MKTLEICLSLLFTNNLIFFHFFGIPELLHSSFKKRYIFIFFIILSLASFFLWFFIRLVPAPFEAIFTPLILSILLIGFTGLYLVIEKKLFNQKILLPLGFFSYNSFLIGATLIIAGEAPQWYDVFLLALTASIAIIFAFAFFHLLETRFAREKLPKIVQGLPIKLIICSLVCLILAGMGA